MITLEKLDERTGLERHHEQYYVLYSKLIAYWEERVQIRLEAYFSWI